MVEKVEGLVFIMFDGGGGSFSDWEFFKFVGDDSELFVEGVVRKRNKKLFLVYFNINYFVCVFVCFV